MLTGRTRMMNRTIQEKKVSTGLEDTSEGSLGDTIQKWNESYFAKLGLSARLTLSESAMRQPNHKSKIMRKPTLLYDTREERERKREDRKFVIVVSRLDDSGPSHENAQELEAETVRVELPVAEDPRNDKAELPGDEEHVAKELPMPGDQAKEDLANVYCQVAELPADVPTELPASLPEHLGKLKLEGDGSLTRETLIPLPLDVKAKESENLNP